MEPWLPWLASAATCANGILVLPLDLGPSVFGQVRGRRALTLAFISHRYAVFGR